MVKRTIATPKYRASVTYTLEISAEFVFKAKNQKFADATAYLLANKVLGALALEAGIEECDVWSVDSTEFHVTDVSKEEDDAN